MASGRAILLKEDGNKCFQQADYVGAEALYSKAIIADSTNPLLFTNRAMARLKLSHWEPVIEDCLSSINLLDENMKAYYYLAQAQIALHHPNEALSSALRAFELCVKSQDKSIAAITALVLRCKKEKWEVRERQRLRGRNTLLDQLVEGLQEKMEAEVREIRGAEEKGEIGMETARDDVDETERTCREKVEELRSVFEVADPENCKRREVPEWAIDSITFAVMHDPVMTKTGHSYDRASITEHLRRSHTDPLTRAPLHVEDLRPNLGLKAACEEFLTENGWAVDW